MAEYGEWNRKGATLSDVTAATEYGREGCASTQSMIGAFAQWVVLGRVWDRAGKEICT